MDSVSAGVLSATTETDTVSAGMLWHQWKCMLHQQKPAVPWQQYVFLNVKWAAIVGGRTVKAEVGNNLGEEGPVLVTERLAPRDWDPPRVEEDVDASEKCRSLG